MDAIVHADVSYIECSVGAEDGTYPIHVPYAVLTCRVVPEEGVVPDVVPNTMDDEPSALQSYALVPAPSPNQPRTEAETVPRRKLPRRATPRAPSRPSPLPSPPPVVVPELVPEEPAVPASVEEPPLPHSAPTRRVRVLPLSSGC